MAKISFFPLAAAPSLGEIAQWTGAKLGESADPDRIVRDVAPLDEAGPDDLTFLDNPRYLEAYRATRAGAAFVAPRYAAQAPQGCALLITPQPYRAMAETMARLYPQAARPRSAFGETGVSPAAFVHSAARLEPGVVVDPGAVIGPGAEIGAGALIGPNAVVGPGVRIGRDSVVGAQATVACALVGDRVIIHPGVHIGQDGFGFALGPRGHLKVPQVGRVIIQDDVEIGAGTTIDRGANRDTIIGEGTKIDNLVQIAHNVVIGRHCVLVAQCGRLGLDGDRRFRRPRRPGWPDRPSDHRRRRADRRPVRGNERRAGGREMGRIPGHPAARVSPPGGDLASTGDRRPGAERRLTAT